MSATDAELAAAIDRGIAAGDLLVLTPELLATMGGCGVCATFPPAVVARNVCMHEQADRLEEAVRDAQAASR